MTNRYMTKFAYVRHYIELFDFVFWIDDDAFFVDLQKSLDPFVPPTGKLASFCKSPTNKKIFTYLSSGQFLMRGGSESAALIDAVVNTPMDVVEEWWREDLGMYTKGDQDALVYVLHENPRFKNSVELFDYSAFNSRIADLETTPDRVFLLHFTGPRDRKLADAHRAAELLGTGPSLIPNELEKDLLGGRSRKSVLAPAFSKSKRKGRKSILSRLFRQLKR
ncbi:MAG: hypothetical protein AAFR98_12935 [Pseudomonadota bacterium]